MDKRRGEQDPAKGRGERQRKGLRREIINVAAYGAVVLFVAFLIVTYVGQRTQVSGESMYPTLYDGDNLLVDKLSYRFREPQRFDIIVFPYRYREKTYYIKRIVGLPGETVQIVDGCVYIDGKLLKEDYGREVMEKAGLAAEPVTLGEDEYFVLGDNRNESEDSRFPDVGSIKRRNIIGRALLRIWPFDRVGFLND